MSQAPSRVRPAVIVDPFLSGSDLAPAFLARGVPCVAVLTDPKVTEALTLRWRPEHFTHVHSFDGDIGALARAIEEHNPLCVVAGFESGVEVADALVDIVLPGSGHVPGLSSARRDKHQMGLALQAAGVRHLRHVCADRHADVEAWIRTTGLVGHRLVLKPPRSGGTDDVYLVEEDADWRPSFDRILGKVNAFKARNDTVLVQEFAAGTEYIVDTYSVDGRHGLVDVCRYSKSTRGDRIGIYDRIDFVPPDDPVVAPLFAYVQQVLDAVGIRNGAAHGEVMFTATGPVLIEVGARAGGGALHYAGRFATGDSQVDRCVAHRVDGTFRPHYELRRHLRAAFLSSPSAGVLRNAEILEQHRAPAVHSMSLHYGTGDAVPATVDFMTTLGHVFLTADDEGEIDRAYDEIRRIEAQLRIDAENEAANA